MNNNINTFKETVEKINKNGKAHIKVLSQDIKTACETGRYRKDWYPEQTLAEISYTNIPEHCLIKIVGKTTGDLTDGKTVKRSYTADHLEPDNFLKDDKSLEIYMEGKDKEGLYLAEKSEALCWAVVKGREEYRYPLCANIVSSVVRYIDEIYENLALKIHQSNEEDIEHEGRKSEMENEEPEKIKNAKAKTDGSGNHYAVFTLENGEKIKMNMKTGENLVESVYSYSIWGLDFIKFNADGKEISIPVNKIVLVENLT